MNLIVVWAQHDGLHGIPDQHPQFVAAFPASLREAMPELYGEWYRAACQQYRDEVDSPVVAFWEGSAEIRRPNSFRDAAIELSALVR